MNVECPEFDLLINEKTEEMFDDQRVYYNLMTRVNDFFSSGLLNYFDYTTNKYIEMTTSKFCDTLFDGIYRNVNCDEFVAVDEIMEALLMCNDAMRNIVSNPNSVLVKEEKKVYLNNLKGHSSKTMEWLAKRAGRTVQEKILPENKILTKITQFTECTLENEVTLALYMFLYEIINKRLLCSSCKECNNNFSCKNIYDKALSFVNLFPKIHRGSLSEVVPKRHNIPNNKLLCDRNYSIIWKAQTKINSYEDNVIKKWDNLYPRFKQMIFWFVAGLIYNRENVSVDDITGVFVTEDNKFGFYTDKECTRILDRLRFIVDKNSLSYNEITLFIKNDTLLINKRNINFNETTNYAKISNENEFELINVLELFESFYTNV